MRISLVLVVLAACSGDKVTSFDSAKQVSSLSGDDKKQLCKDVNSYRKKKVAAGDGQRIACGGEAIVAVMSAKGADVKTKCKQAFDECMKKPAKDDGDIDCDKQGMADQLASCGDLSVGELSDCVKESVQMFADLAKEDLCASLDPEHPDSALDKLLDKMKGPKCATMENKCGKKKRAGGDEDAAKRATAAEEAAEAARRVAKDAAATIEKMQGELTEIATQVDKATADLAAATDKAARDLAQQKLTELQKMKTAMEAKLAEAKTMAASAKRAQGVHVSKECMDNPLAKGCE